MMAYNGVRLAISVMDYNIPTLGIPEGLNDVRGDRRRPDRAVRDGAHRRDIARTDVEPDGTDDPFATFFGFLIMGVPVAFAIGLSAVCTMVYDGLPLAVVFQRMVSGITVFSFLAIPFFIFAGELMLYGGIADRIVAFAEELGRPHPRWSRHVQRGRLHALRRRVRLGGRGHVGDGRGHDSDDEARGLRHGLRGERHDARVARRRADTDVAQHDHLLAGGGGQGIDRGADHGWHDPGADPDLCKLAAAYLVAVKRGYPAGHFPGWNAVLWCVPRRRLPACSSTVIIIGGMLSGVFTATESASVAVIYALLVTVLVYRRLTVGEFPRRPPPRRSRRPGRCCC